MSNPKIQVKRTHNNATVPTLSHGELAYQHNGGTAAQEGLLLIGRPGTSSGNEVNDIVGGKIYVDKVTALENVGAEANPDVASSAEINAGTSTDERTFTPAKIKQAVEAHSINTTPAATSSAVGGIKLHSATAQSTAPETVSSTANRTYAVQLDSDGKASVNVPWSDTDTNTVYTLPEATATAKGGIELFSNTDQSVAANAVTATAGKTYGIQLNSDGQAVVNVPWTDTNTQRAIHDSPVDGAATTSISSNWAFDNVKTSVPSGALFTDTNTTYSAGTGMSLSAGNQFSIGQAVGTSSDVTFGSGGLTKRFEVNEHGVGIGQDADANYKLKVNGDALMGTLKAQRVESSQGKIVSANTAPEVVWQDTSTNHADVSYKNDDGTMTATYHTHWNDEGGTDTTHEIFKTNLYGMSIGSATAGANAGVIQTTPDNTTRFFVNGSANISTNLTVGGSLTVEGTLTTVNTEEINLADNFINLNSNLANNVNATEDTGIEVNRGAYTNVKLFWEENTDAWKIQTAGNDANAATDNVLAHSGNFNTLLNVDTNTIDCGTF